MGHTETHTPKPSSWAFLNKPGLTPKCNKMHWVRLLENCFTNSAWDRHYHVNRTAQWQRVNNSKKSALAYFDKLLPGLS